MERETSGLGVQVSADLPVPFSLQMETSDGIQTPKTRLTDK